MKLVLVIHLKRDFTDQPIQCLYDILGGVVTIQQNVTEADTSKYTNPVSSLDLIIM